MIFVNKCDCIFDQEELEGAILWYIAGLRYKETFTIWLDKFYPKIFVRHKSVGVHRLLYMYKEKRVLKKSETVYHIDGNKLNNNIENLKTRSWNNSIKFHNDWYKVI